MDIQNDYADPELEEGGVWLKLAAGGDIKLARLTSKRFTAALQKAMEPFAMLKAGGNFDTDHEDEIYINVMSEHLILDWGTKENPWMNAGKPFPYNKKNAHYFLARSRDFRNEIIQLASMMDNFIRAKEAQAVKNSRKPSSGTSDTETENADGAG